MSQTTDTTTFDRDDPPILGANPFVGLTREQVAAAIARLAQRVAVEPGAAAAAAVDAVGELARVAIGRSETAPARADRRASLPSTMSASVTPTSSSGPSARPAGERRMLGRFPGERSCLSLVCRARPGQPRLARTTPDDPVDTTHRRTAP
jgi:hypothetical protein